MDQIERPYGTWMKAEPKRRNYTMGAQWLRQGGNLPVSSPSKGRGDSQGEVVTVDGAGRDYNPENSVK